MTIPKTPVSYLKTVDGYSCVTVAITQLLLPNNYITLNNKHLKGYSIFSLLTTVNHQILSKQKMQ